MGESVREIMLDFERVAKKTGVSVRAARNETISQAALAVVRNTPVRTGRLRASWFFSPTFPTVARAPGTSEVSDAAQNSAVLQRLGTAVPGDFIKDGALYFLNGASYAIFVEARTQFVRRALAKAGQIEEAAVRSIRRLQSRRR